MRLPSKTRPDVVASSNHFLRRVNSIVAVPLGEIDYLRGNTDDFFGDFIMDEYEQQTVGGAGSQIYLYDGGAGNTGGGVYMQTHAAIGAYARLWKGNSAYNYDTLDADDGWVQICRAKVQSVAGVGTDYFANPLAAETAGGNAIFVEYDSTVSANWLLESQSGGGAITQTDSGVAKDENWHWHTLRVYPITGGHQADHYLDGALINSKTTDMPNAVLTPFVRIHTLSAATRSMRLDFWRVFPRNP